MTLEEYAREVADYLQNKVPNINLATVCEIAEFFVMKSNNFAMDKITESNKMWQKELRDNNERWKEFVRNTYK